ncbi:MAG: hypothetical protein AB1511_05830 [Deinococcota bacterium]
MKQDRVALIGNVGPELQTPLAELRGYKEALTDGLRLLALPRRSARARLQLT